MFIAWYQVFHPTFTCLSLGDRTCSFVCHLNSTESIQSCSHFGASYTLPSLSYQVLIFTWVKWTDLPKDTTSKQCPNIERRETLYFSQNPAPSRIRNRTAGSDIDKAQRSNHCAMSIVPVSGYQTIFNVTHLDMGMLKMVELLYWYIIKHKHIYLMTIFKKMPIISQRGNLRRHLKFTINVWYH